MAMWSKGMVAVAAFATLSVSSLNSQQIFCWLACRELTYVAIGATTVTVYSQPHCVANSIPVAQGTGMRGALCLANVNTINSYTVTGIQKCNNFGIFPQQGFTDIEGEFSMGPLHRTCHVSNDGTPPEP